MQDFSSISVSSYEAGVLADRLTEQSREGWEVVAIVPTGSTVTAYLSRSAGAAVEEVVEEVVEAVTEPADVEPEPEPADTEPDAEAPANPEAITKTETDEIVPESATADNIGWAALASEVAEAADDEIVPSLPEAAPVVAEIAIEPEPASPEPEPQPAPAAEATTEVDAVAAAGAAPAGWYADPSARFELRYWDGAQWTEHVSRAGQQYTDPPVA